MGYYHKAGILPDVKHTAFYKDNGKSIYREELFSSRGFADAYSTKYHYNMPPAMSDIQLVSEIKKESWADAPFEPCHFFTEKVPAEGDFIKGRSPLLENDHVLISVAKITGATEAYYKNASCWEYLYIHHGTGELRSDFGRLALKPGDHVVIPKNVIYQLKFEDYQKVKLFMLESREALDFPAHYTNARGQLKETAPFCERDIQVPELASPITDAGEFNVYIKKEGRLYRQTLPHHPFDVVGWDGYLYPFSLNIHAFNPLVGRIHLPPPVHAIFENSHLVLCNFVPRPFDFHSQAIPAPYFHSNIDCDEVLYYIEGDFMSRKGIEEGSITLHPAGLIHGPQPGKTEDSVGKKYTDELAVMVDTFEPLRPTTHVKNSLDTDYKQSWMEK